MDLAWYTEKLRLKLFREYLVSISVWGFQAFFTWSHSFDSFLLLERFNQKLSLLCSLLFLNFIEEYYLFVMLSCAQWSCFNEITENGRLSKFVDECIRFRAIFLSSKFWETETVSRVYPIWYGAVIIVNVFEKFTVVRHNFWHEF